MTQQLAVQLYTLRDETARDFPGTLRQVAELGYAGVEFAGFGSHSARELRSVLDGVGLTTAGAHIPLTRLESDLDGAIEDVQTLGARNLACPFLPPERRRSGDDYRRVGDTLTKIGARCRDAGLQLSYHNHAFEFEKFDGRTGLDLLLEAADPDLVKLELDLAWITDAGEDAAAFLRRYKGRAPLVHFKDLSTDPQRKFAPVGSGRVSFPELIAAASDAGVEWIVVEQDDPQPPAIDSVRQSITFLREHGLG